MELEKYDTVYRKIISDPAELDVIALRCQGVAQYLTGNSILDLGCGLGMMSAYTSIPYTGIDFSTVAITYARQNYQATFVCGSFDYPFTEKFDTVLLMEVLEHLELPDREKLLTTALNLAQQRIVITVPINIPMDGHIKPCWTTEELYRLLPASRIDINSFERWWIGVYDL